ncbi:gametocyte-specific factor 1 homolog [Pectinophora gossypiella]|uniref:gametocyte-specific factor 1 homolog n=1 Tax=Pectinophora gossypiella TaxID=13191 RepID=UPI00214F2597|nr:gametocyte-specific factor 1 homolog [Pectinophora gossypiella]XP_049884417.1 gametocyte-specific factor 1 homolog [Pectinophora gossypiella]
MEPEPHAMMSCPYNKAHQVEHYRFHVHLQKCRRQYPNCNKVSCPLDATHIVNDVELDYHVKNVCTKRILFESQLYVTDDEARAPEVIIPAPVSTDENWDDENVSSYKPDLSKKASNIIVKPRGLAPAERRKLRMENIKTYRPQEDQ